jgi:hypothetical protein
MTRTTLAGAAVLVLLSGCTRGFVRPAATEQEFWHDVNECDRETQAQWSFCTGLACIDQANAAKGRRNRCMFERGWRLSRDSEAYRP